MGVGGGGQRVPATPTVKGTYLRMTILHYTESGKSFQTASGVSAKAEHIISLDTQGRVAEWPALKANLHKCLSFQTFSKQSCTM